MTSRPDSISDVIARLPGEVYANPTARGLLAIARDVGVYALIVAALIAVDAWWALPVLWMLAGLAIAGLFILGHDAAHESLFASKKLCRIAGRACMLPSLHVYEAWRFGHNRIHHGHTTRESMDYVWHPLTPEEYRQLPPLRRGVHRLKWSWLGAGIYYGWDIWWRQMMRFEPPEKIADTLRSERRWVWAYAAGVSLALLAAGLWHYGSAAGALWMWIKVFGMPFVAWNYCIGWVVYVHHISPEIPWQGRRAWDRMQAQMEATTVVHVPRWVNFFLHDIFLHVPHHVDMRIPFYHLRLATRLIQADFGDIVVERRYRVRDYLRTTRSCKLFDFENGRWLTYREALEG